jgi:hypothetical protein
MFSTRSVPKYCEESVSDLEEWWGPVFVSCCCEKLGSEAGDCSGTQRKGNVRRWNALSSNDCLRCFRRGATRLCHETDHFPPSGAETENAWT